MTSEPNLDALAATLTEPRTAVGLDVLRQVLDAMPVMVAINGSDRRIAFTNRAYQQYMGRPADDLLGRTVGDLLGEDVMRATQADVARALRGETVQIEGWLANPDGEQSYMLRIYGPSRDGDGAVSGYFVLLQDMTERRKAQDGLFRLAYYDPVTGLANRLMLLKHMADHHAVGEPYTVMIVDIDRFVDIRTSLGQAFADELLVDLAARLSRDGGPVDLLARISDHAFALMIAGPCEQAAMERRGETLSAIVRSARSRSGAAAFLSASVGVATASPLHEKPEDVLRDAEIASSRVRETGGGRFAWFDPAMHARVVEQVRIEHDLRRALEKDEGLWVAYQPIVELVTGGLAGFEALVRWNHPEFGNIPPVAFIPIAERTGLVVALGKWVLRQALVQIADWQEKRAAGSAPLFMSVNLSPRQLVEPDFIGVVRGVLRETGAEPTWLKLEITESAVMEKAEQAIEILRGLRQLGIKMSIDDFGTGYSSLSYLHKLPIDSLKVDRSFVMQVHQSEENRAIVRIIVDLARLLGFDVIAEGIETVADANLLRALACDYGQGYHFAKPLPAPQAEELVVGDSLPWREGPR